MTFPDLTKELGNWFKRVRGMLESNVSLSKYCWFRTGGPAQLLYQPADEEDLAMFLEGLPGDIPITLIGLGSNILVRDGGVPGVVIRLSARGFGFFTPKDDYQIEAGAILPDLKLAQFSAKAGIGGFSFYRGIPGSIGGALRMNAGCYGSETKDRVKKIKAFDRSGCLHILPLEDMGYGYRHCKAPKDLIFVSAVFQGTPASSDELKQQMEAVTEQREGSQPVKSRTGGSTFKNPEGYKAWQLIDKAGCRGLVLGGAQVSERHCNFLINREEASGHDLEALGEEVRRRVFETSGISLQWEIRRIGIPLSPPSAF